MKGDAVPDQHHVLRYIGGRHIDVDADGRPVVLGGGFISRPRDNNRPSYNWLECLHGSLNEQVQQVRGAARIRYGATGRLARLNVGSVVRAARAGSVTGRDIALLQDPLDAEGGWPPDPSHAVMTNVPDQDDPDGELIGDLIANCVLDSFPARTP